MHNVSPARRSRWQCHAKRRDANMDSNPVPARPHSEISRQQQAMCHNKDTNRRFIKQKHSLRIPLLTNLFVSKTTGCAINSSFRSLSKFHVYTYQKQRHKTNHIQDTLNGFMSTYLLDKSVLWTFQAMSWLSTAPAIAIRILSCRSSSSIAFHLPH